MPYKDPEANRAYKRAYYQANKDRDRPKKRLISRRYRARHPEKTHAALLTYRRENREAINARRRELRRAHPDKAHAADQRYNRARKPQEPTPEQRLKRRLGEQARYHANPEKYRARKRAVLRAHPERYTINAARRRARIHGAPINDLTAAQWEAIKAHYGHRCVYCDRRMQRLSQDHIVPLSKGGSHTLSNVVPACKSCNSKKHAGPPPVPVQPLLLV